MATGLEHCKLPTPQPLAYTTPAGAATLGECKLRTAYDSNSSFRGLAPSSPAARLGTACHRVFELAGAGALPPPDDPNWREAFEAAWASAIAEQEEQRCKTPLESHWPPPDRWPYYAARKVAARRLCARIGGTASGSAGSGGNRQELLEQRQEAFEGKLRGRADVIRRSPEPEIEDYKTGSLFDEEAGDVKPHYRTQMLLYAVLEHEATGVWPKRATLIPLHGEPATIDINPAEADDAAAAALRALAEYNQAVTDAVPAISLAGPSPDTCRFCPYTIQCPAFWSAVGPAWLDEGILALAGELLGREESRLSTFNVRIRKAAGSVEEGEYLLYQLDAERFGPLLAIPLGAEIAALWLTGDTDARTLRPTLRTRIALALSETAGNAVESPDR